MKTVQFIARTALAFILLVAVLLICGLLFSMPRLAYSATPPITVPPRFSEVPVEQSKDRPNIEGHPVSSVVVTQCNLIVAVYMTMKDGRLLRFDKTAAVPSDQLMQMAYSAERSERIEVSCNETGVVGYEKRDPI